MEQKNSSPKRSDWYDDGGLVREVQRPQVQCAGANPQVPGSAGAGPKVPGGAGACPKVPASAGASPQGGARTPRGAKTQAPRQGKFRKDGHGVLLLT